MSTRSYWLDLFSGTTWREFLDAGSSVSGFRRNRWRTVQKMQPGDYLLCYMTGISRWIGVLEVTSDPFLDDSPIWRDADFPSRVRVRPVVCLTPEIAVPVLDLSDRLTFFQNLSSPLAWTGHFRGSPSRWKSADGDAVVQALLDAKRNPISRPYDQRKLDRRPKVLGTKVGKEVVPGPEDPEEVIAEVAQLLPSKPAIREENAVPVEPQPARDATDHEEIQWLLLKLGNDMGLDVWVARNDRGREVNGQRFADLPRFRREFVVDRDK